MFGEIKLVILFLITNICANMFMHPPPPPPPCVQTLSDFIYIPSGRHEIPCTGDISSPELIQTACQC